MLESAITAYLSAMAGESGEVVARARAAIAHLGEAGVMSAKDTSSLLSDLLAALAAAEARATRAEERIAEMEGVLAPITALPTDTSAAQPAPSVPGESEMKLTKARRELLLEAANPGGAREGRFIAPGTSCVPQYRPALWLVERGLARWRRDDPDTRRLIATDAGRAALAAAEEV